MSPPDLRWANEATKKIDMAQNVRIQIKNYFEKNGTKEQLEEIREKVAVRCRLDPSLLPSMFRSVQFNDREVEIIQSRFRTQSLKKLCENVFKDALPFLEEIWKRQLGKTPENEKNTFSEDMFI